MDFEGRITYLNPAAAIKFPNLREVGTEHPILTGLLIGVNNLENNSFVREVEVDTEVFEQSVLYLPESDLIRTFIIRDITEQKRATAELRQRDRLLQAVAEAANYLLGEMNYETRIDRALAVLGEAAKADRAYLFENHPHPVTEEIAVSLKFEWTRSCIKSTHHHWQNQPYQAPRLARWYTVLSSGQSIIGITQKFPAAEQEFLIRDGIQSLLLVPLRLDNDFWGYLGLADCTFERHWSNYY